MALPTPHVHYKLEDDLLVNNDEQGNFDLTFNGTSGNWVHETGVDGDSIRAAHEDNYLTSAGLGSWFSGRTECTISMWAKPPQAIDGTGFTFCVSNTSHVSPHYRVALYIDTYGTVYIYKNTSAPQASIPWPYALDRAAHLSMVLTSTGISLYINGVEAIAEQAIAGAIGATTADAMFGRIPARNITTNSALIDLDDVKIFSEALDASQAEELYSSYFDTSTYGGLIQSLVPVAYYRLAEAGGNGSTAVDETGNYNGTYISSSVSVPGLLGSDPDNAAIQLSGTSIDTGLISSTGAWSVSGIITATSPSGVNALFAPVTAGGGLTLYVYDSKFQIYIGSWLDTSFSVALNQTYHVVLTGDGVSVKLYVDGVEVYSYLSAAYPDLSLRYIGKRWDGNSVQNYFGIVDEVAVFDKTLLDTEVAALYSFGTSVSVEETILGLSPDAYWKLSDGSAEAVTDESTNGYDGVWVGVHSDEATQDDMLSDGVLGVKPADASATPTGYMENTAVFALGSADTGNYTATVWAKGFSGTDMEIMSWATTAISSTKEYRGKITVNTSGEISWNRLYQTGTSVVNDTGYQSTTTSGLGLLPDVPYLFALRESSTLTEILVNGSVVISLPRVGMGTNDTTYAPREEFRIGNETIYSGSTTASSYVHGALWNSVLTDANILSIYNAWSAIDKDATIAGVQSGQTGTGTAEKTGSLATTGTIVGYQEDRLLEAGEFISQSANIAATYVSPDNYIVSNQIPQGVLMSGVSTGDPLTVRYSTHGITTTPTSTPADTPIKPRLLNAGNYKNEIDISDVGVVTPSFGQVVLDNSDGDLDGLVDKAFDGGSYKLYYGPKNGTFPDDFTIVVDTVMGKPTFDHSTVKVQLKDKMDFLDVPMINSSFTGTGSANGEAIVKGEPKQRVIGRVWGIPVQLINAEKLVYWVSSDEMASDNTTNNNNGYTDNVYRSPPNNWNDSYSSIAYGRVFDGGTQIINGADYASEADLFSIEPAAGTVRWYRPSGFGGPIMFRLGSSPAADIRVDTETTSGGASNWGLNDLVGERPEFDISSSSANVTLERGFFVNDSSFTYKDAIKEFMKRDFYFARFDRAGEFKVSQVATPDPSETPTYEFNEANMASVVIEQKVPAWRLHISSGEAVGGQVNTGIGDARKDEFTESPYHTITEYEEPATRSRHKLSEIITVDTKSWWSQEDIDTHSDLARVFLMEDRVKITVTLDRGHMNATTLLLDIGDIVSVKMSRYNFDLGKNFVVHGVRVDYGTGRQTFSLWG